jgi:peptidoglycan/xylan/chitin deacetylase (PgdA/CDA1 family)
VTRNGLWRPGADPNARTQALAGVPAQQRGDDEAPELERTALYPGGGDGGFTGYGEDPGPGGRRPNRRRVLFAAGGLMLLAGGGAAAAMASSGGTKNTASGPTASPAPTTAPSPTRTVPPSTRPPSTTPPASSANPSSTTAATQPQWYVDNDGPMAIALTMDDGPDPQWTPQVLEILRQYDIKATFNMVGRSVAGHLPLVREVSSEGHTITNHTWDHADLTHYTFNQVVSEIDRTNDVLANADQHPTIFRAPFGNWSHAVFEACAARSLRPVGWSVDPRDWDTAHVTTDMIVHNVLTHTHAHDIILEHDGGGTSRAHTVAALRIFIPKLLDRGFRFVAM